ncbi:MAG: hypothetical protein FVQ79_09600 [Planctomycetes bacterium]|nr:hypothetical protein [Planctomycetota bacterium]
MTTKIEISKDELLSDGDVIEYHFEWITNNTWVRAAQIALIENKLRARPDLELISSSYLGKDLVLRIEHIDTGEKAGLGKRISVGFMQSTIMAVAAPVLIFTGIKKAYRIAKKAAMIGTAVLVPIAVVVGYFLLRKK